MRPIKNYPGGKHGNGTYQAIINHIPKHTIYVEPFLGSGGILFNMRLPETVILNDISRSVIDKYIYAGHNLAFSSMLPGSIDDSAYMGPQKGSFNYVSWQDVSIYKVLQKKASMPAGIPAVFFYSMDYQDILKPLCSSIGVFAYLDPPYLFETRSSQRGIYDVEWSMNDHHRFVDFVKQLPFDCMISHYPCDFYDQHLSEWSKYEYQSMTRRGLVTECIYMNYHPPSVLQDYSYIGNDFTDRQRIKRKLQSLHRKFLAMTDLERNAFLSMLQLEKL